MTKIAINILLLFAVLTACTSAPQGEIIAYADFPETQELQGQVIPLDTALFRYPFRIRRQGDKAVVMDMHGQETYFHLFHYPDFRYLSSFGKLGETTGEMLSAENIRWRESTRKATAQDG